jgi:hypothetical protein
VCARPAGFKKLGHNSTELSDYMLIHNTDFCGFTRRWFSRRYDSF